MCMPPDGCCFSLPDGGFLFKTNKQTNSMKASVLLKALEAYGDLDVCVIKETSPMAYNDTDHHKAVDAKVFAIMGDKLIIAEKEIRID